MKHAILNREFGEVRTVVVLGVGRGGTSLIAGCLRALGICMGINPHPLKHEWSPVIYSQDGKVDAAASRGVIAQMDREHEKWGWKSPRDVFQLDQIISILREPGFILVTRDILTAALSGLSYQDVPIYISLDETATVYHAITTRLRFWPWPTLILSFADALQNPELLVNLLCSFMNIDPGTSMREQAAKFVRPGINAYRLHDAKPDDPPFLTSPEDLRADSKGLALDLSQRYAKEYSQHLEQMLAKAKTAARNLSSRFAHLMELGIMHELSDQLCRIFTVIPVSRLKIWFVHKRLSRARTKDEFQAGLDSLLEQLSIAAKRANEEFTARSADGNYDALTRVYRVLQVAIRVRNALQRGIYLTDFASPAPPQRAE